MKKNKHTLIIGGSRGIGKATTHFFQLNKNNVSVLSNSTPEMEISNNLFFLQTNITDTDQLNTNLDSCIKKFGPISNLIFCQRYRQNEDDWQGEIETSLTATKLCIDYLSTKFKHNNINSIVIISSILGSFVAKDTPLSYHVCKGALIQLVRYYAIKLASLNIRINSVSPGTILKSESKEFYLNNKNINDLYTKINPSGKMGSAEEIAEIIYFLCTPSAYLINGQDIIADGGLSLQWQETLSKNLLNIS